MKDGQTSDSSAGIPPHLEELLVYRIRGKVMTMAAATIGVIATVLGFLGIRQIWDLQQTAADAQKLVTEWKGEHSRLIQGEEEKFKELKRAIDDQLASTGQTKAALDTAKTDAIETAKASRESTLQLSQQASSQAGEIKGRFAASMDDIARQQAEVRTVLNGVRSDAADLNRVRGELGTYREDWERTLKDSMDALRVELKDLKKLSQDLSERVFGGTTQLIREKSLAPLPTTPTDPQQPFTIQVGVFHESSLEGLAIRDREQAVLVKPQNVRVGEVIRFSTRTYDYVLTSQYILELVFEKDAAGIDLRWVRHELERKQ